MARTISKALAGITLATSITLSGIIATPTQAAAVPAHTNHTRITGTNWNTFKTGKGSYFEIRVKMTPCRNCAGIPGKAQLKLDGKHQRFRKLDHGSITFRVHRNQLRNNKWVEVAVRTWPKRDGRPSTVVKFDVRDTKHKKPKASSSQGDSVMKVARAQLGKPYRWGGAGPGSYDCSGLTAYAYKHGVGIKLPHYSGAQRNAGRKVTTPRRGDIAWTPGHVSLCANNGCTVVIEAARPGTNVRRVSKWQRGAIYIRP